MSDRLPVRQLPLAQQVEEILIDRIRSGVYLPDTQLPPENNLAAELNVSRATVRSALNTLAAHGLVVRRQGAGTFVTQMPSITNPLDKAIDFLALIAASQRQPGVEQVACQVEPVGESMAAALRLEPGSQALTIYKVFTADKEPVIYCINTVALWLFSEELLKQTIQNPNMLEPLYEFLETECNQRVEYHVARVHPSVAKACHFIKPLPLDPHTPILVIDEVGFNAGGQPVFHTYEYHPENRMSFELIRRRV
jgi:GntR family transcriptional regulator